MIEHHSLLDRLDYDPSTGVFRWKVSPSNSVKVGAVAGCKSENGTVITIDRCKYYGHTLAWLYVTGEWPDEVKHRNGDVHDDRFSNLALTNAAQRTQGIEIRKDNKVGVRGIIKRGARYCVQIRRSGQVHHSSHRTLEDAVAAQRQALASIEAKRRTKDGT